MKLIAAAVLTGVLVSSAFGQAIPPTNLQAELLQAGEVSLTWEEPPDGLFEDFNDGVGQGFEWDMGNGGALTIEDGFAKIDMTSSSDTWGSGAYTMLDFNDFSAELTFQNGSGNLSRGLIFYSNGVNDDDFNGYGFWLGYNTVGYSVWKYTNGFASNVVSWTQSQYCNPNPGEWNTLRVEAVGSTWDLYLNGQYVDTGTDATYTNGFLGFGSAYSNEVWFDEISGFYGAQLIPPGTHGESSSEPNAAVHDHFDQPIEPGLSSSRMSMQVTPLSLPGESQQREIDEFVEYRIYRDGQYLGSSMTEAFTDNLPQPGEYEYTVTAYYDPEGESSPAGPLLVNWEPVVLTLTGQITTVPPEGGLIYYDASIWNTLPQNFPNVNWWTSVLLPNGQQFGPLVLMNVTIPGFINITVQGLNQNIPELSPAGTYTFTGHVGYYPNSILQDSFDFEKQGVNANAIQFDPDDWVGSGLALAADAEISVPLPEAYALSEAYPNPFNPSTSITVSLPSSAELTVAVYNIAGQQVATLADGMTSAGQHQYTFDANGLASGLYFVQAVVPDHLNEIRKVTLLR